MLSLSSRLEFLGIPSQLLRRIADTHTPVFLQTTPELNGQLVPATIAGKGQVAFIFDPLEVSSLQVVHSLVPEVSSDDILIGVKSF